MNRTKVLFDECVNVEFAIEIYKNINKKKFELVHLSDLSLLVREGTKDYEIVDYMKDNNFNVLITHDKEFCENIINREQGYETNGIKVILVPSIQVYKKTPKLVMIKGRLTKVRECTYILKNGVEKEIKKTVSQLENLIL